MKIFISRKGLAVGALLLVVLVLAALIGTNTLRLTSSLCSEVEANRIQSPSKIVDAVVVEKDCGATTSLAKYLSIVPSGKSSPSSGPVAILDRNDDLSVRWIDTACLLVTYNAARIHDFSNHAYVRTENNLLEFGVLLVAKSWSVTPSSCDSVP